MLTFHNSQEKKMKKQKKKKKLFVSNLYGNAELAISAGLQQIERGQKVCMNQHNRFLCELKIPQNLDSDPTNNF